jgi:hypothetical protein
MKSIDLLHLLSRAKKNIKAIFSSTKSGSFQAMLEVTLIKVTASGLYRVTDYTPAKFREKKCSTVSQLGSLTQRRFMSSYLYTENALR